MLRAYALLSTSRQKKPFRFIDQKSHVANELHWTFDIEWYSSIYSVIHFEKDDEVEVQACLADS